MKNINTGSVHNGITDEQIAVNIYSRLSNTLPTNVTWIRIWKSINMNVSGETWLSVAAISQQNL